MTTEFRQKRLVIVGNSEVFHVGAMLRRSAVALGLETTLFDTRSAFQAAWVVRQVNWRLRGHYPSQLRRFDKELIALCHTFRPDLVLVTGLVPPSASALTTIRQMGIPCANYLTDDPWNPAHRAGWFLEALPNYGLIFSPRRANLPDLEQAGCRAEYIPFAFDPALHYPEAPPSDIASGLECDMLFYGGADQDRVALIAGVIAAGINTHLYGSYWDRYPQTRRAARGMADLRMLRWAVNRAKVTLCLVRRANRDGHVMRTFEAAAMGACLLVEDTLEHREIYGPEGDTVLYFRTVEDVIDKTRYLLDHPADRARLIAGAQRQVVHSGNTYASRLMVMLQAIQNGDKGIRGER